MGDELPPGGGTMTPTGQSEPTAVFIEQASVLSISSGGTTTTWGYDAADHAYYPSGQDHTSGLDKIVYECQLTDTDGRCIRWGYTKYHRNSASGPWAPGETGIAKKV